MFHIHMRVMYIKPDEFQELPSYLSPPLFNAMFGSFTTVPAPKGNKNPESTPSWMDVAKSQDIPEPVAEAAPSYAPTTRVQQLTRNVLNSDVEVIGSLRFSDDLLIDGTVEGDISSEGVLSVGQNAVIRAEINTKSVIIHGKVIGNVTTRSLIVDDGGCFDGRCTMTDPASSSAPMIGSASAEPAEKKLSVDENTASEDTSSDKKA